MQAMAAESERLKSRALLFCKKLLTFPKKLIWKRLWAVTAPNAIPTKSQT